MRIGLRGAFGQSTINLDDSATVGDLCAKITEISASLNYDLKAGFPPRTLDLSQYDVATRLSDTDLRLNGERIQVDISKDEHGAAVSPASNVAVVNKSRMPLPAPLDSSRTSQAKTLSSPQTSSQAGKVQEKQFSLTKKSRKPDAEPPAIRLSDGGFLVHRVMPDDNSCLFRALGKCLMGSELDAVVELRSAVAQGIQGNKELYNEVVLEQDPDEYCKWIQMPDSWGGAVDIQIIAEQFDVEVAAVNLEDCSVQRFNEGRPTRVYLVYSGIHWDSLASNPMGSDGEADFDVTQFDAMDVEIEQKAVEIGRMLSKAGYYTNTSTFSLKCNMCGWRGKGQQDAIEHGKTTGHSDFGEA